MERSLSVLDKFDLLHWLATRSAMERGRLVVQKIDDLIRVRNALVHARVQKEPFGIVREYDAGEQIDVNYDKANWNALGIPKNERDWNDEHTETVIISAVDFLNYFFFEACKLQESAVAKMLCTSSGEVILHTQWESEALSIGEHRFGIKLRFLGR
jgi:hypothetical protein